MPFVLHLLRSSFFLAVVSLLMLTGYGYGLSGDCCAHHAVGLAEHGESAPHEQVPDGAEGCQCVAHQIVVPLTSEPWRVAGADLVPFHFGAHADEYPPETVPLGIDYPPQLAACLTRIVAP